jgi:hypothetical protein
MLKETKVQGYFERDMKDKIPEFLREHRLIGPLVVEANEIWKETWFDFSSIRARQELLIEKFFPKGLFIPRQTILAKNQDAVYKAIWSVLQDPFSSVGIRTAYRNPRGIGKTPWLMQTLGETRNDFFEKAKQNYLKWIDRSSNLEIPEAIIVMSNPLGLGDRGLAKNCFVVRLKIEPETSVCQIEGKAWTDQTRDLEETKIENGIRVKNPDFDNKKLFHGNFSYEITPYNIKIREVKWDEEFLRNSDEETSRLIQNVGLFFEHLTGMNKLMARMIALNYVTHHIVIQFQGRKNTTSKEESYFDFFLGYDIRGAEEYEFGRETKKQFLQGYCSTELKSWQRQNYE